MSKGIYIRKKGIGGMTGKRHSEETKKKIIESRKWYKHSKETKLKIAEAHKGNLSGAFGKRWKWSEEAINKRIGINNPYWKDGISKKEILIRNQREQKEWAKEGKKRDDYRCIDCGERGGKLESDHILSFAKYPRLRLEPLNHQTLCKNCHKQKTIFERIGKYTINNVINML